MLKIQGFPLGKITRPFVECLLDACPILASSRWTVWWLWGRCRFKRTTVGCVGVLVHRGLGDLYAREDLLGQAITFDYHSAPQEVGSRRIRSRCLLALPLPCLC
jgi:hypothetical protein